jgi:hypothetical protein
LAVKKKSSRKRGGALLQPHLAEREIVDVVEELPVLVGHHLEVEPTWSGW